MDDFDSMCVVYCVTDEAMCVTDGPVPNKVAVKSHESVNVSVKLFVLGELCCVASWSTV